MIVGCRVVTRAGRADRQTTQGTTIPYDPNGPMLKTDYGSYVCRLRYYWWCKQCCCFCSNTSHCWKQFSLMYFPLHNSLPDECIWELNICFIVASVDRRSIYHGIKASIYITIITEIILIDAMPNPITPAAFIITMFSLHTDVLHNCRQHIIMTREMEHMDQKYTFQLIII